MKLYSKQISNATTSIIYSKLPMSFLVLFAHMLSFQKTYTKFITGSLEVFAYDSAYDKVAKVSYLLNGLDMSKEIEQGSMLLFGMKI